MEKEIPIHISYTNLLTLIINSEGQIRFVTKPMASLLGYTIEELIGSDISKLFAQSELKKLENLVSTTNHKENFELQDFPSFILTKSARSLDLNLKVVQLKNNFLNSFSYAILSDNIIYRNFVSKIFESSKHNLRELYKIANEFIFILTIDRNVVYINKKWKSNFGINQSLESSQTIESLFDQEFASKIKD